MAQTMEALMRPRFTNRLILQAYDQSPGHADSASHRRRLTRLHKEFAKANGVRVSPYEFRLRHIAENKRPSDEPDSLVGSRFITHFECYTRDRRPILLLTEPYDTGVDEIEAEVKRLGLALHAPPNPRASFWNPPWTLCLAVTRPDFGDVRWLVDQLDFHVTGHADLPFIPAEAPAAPT
jgi:hypothetical protein